MNASFFLTAVLALTMSAIFVMPPFQQVESALSTEIPEKLGDWHTATYPPSDKEIAILAKDTEFAKAYCALPRIEEKSYITGESPIDRADLSVVMSGYDLANSIHRPERCMPAQGHKILGSSPAEIELADGRVLPVTRLRTSQSFETGPADNRQPVTVDCVTYYFFVGHDQITASHTERTLIDIKDRVLKGEAQRWAYVSATMQFLDQPDPPRGAPPTLEFADKKIRKLLTELAERNIDWAAVRG